MYCVIYIGMIQFLIFQSVLLMFTDSNSEKPESLLRVEKLTNKSIVYIDCDITNINDLRSVFQKVNMLICSNFTDSTLDSNIQNIFIFTAYFSLRYTFCCIESSW